METRYYLEAMGIGMRSCEGAASGQQFPGSWRPARIIGGARRPSSENAAYVKVKVLVGGVSDWSPYAFEHIIPYGQYFLNLRQKEPKDALSKAHNV